MRDVNQVNDEDTASWIKQQENSHGDLDERYPSAPPTPSELARDAFLAEYCRPATAEDYRAWLDGFIAANPDTEFYTRYHEFNLHQNWYVLVKPVDVNKFTNSRSFELIVPKDVAVYVTLCELGHSQIYFMEDFSMMTFGYHRPEIFKDVKPA